MIMSKSAKIILLDADVISHFISCNEILFLHKILDPHAIAILDNVYKEVARISSRKIILDNLLKSIRAVSVMAFPIRDIEIKKESMLYVKELEAQFSAFGRIQLVTELTNNVVLIDANLFKQIIFNLISNAIRFSASLRTESREPRIVKSVE